MRRQKQTMSMIAILAALIFALPIAASADLGSFSAAPPENFTTSVDFGNVSLRPQDFTLASKMYLHEGRNTHADLVTVKNTIQNPYAPTYSHASGYLADAEALIINESAFPVRLDLYLTQARLDLPASQAMTYLAPVFIRANSEWKLKDSQQINYIISEFMTRNVDDCNIGLFVNVRSLDTNASNTTLNLKIQFFEVAASPIYHDAKALDVPTGMLIGKEASAYATVIDGRIVNKSDMEVFCQVIVRLNPNQGDEFQTGAIDRLILASGTLPAESKTDISEILNAKWEEQLSEILNAAMDGLDYQVDIYMLGSQDEALNVEVNELTIGAEIR